MEAYLERLIRVVTQGPLDPKDLPPLTRRAYGMASPMSDEEAERVLDEVRMRKYGGGE